MGNPEEQGLNIGYDDGLNGDQGIIVGTDIWAKGEVLERARNVALFVYADTPQGFRCAQFIRITPAGLSPALEMLPRN